MRNQIFNIFLLVMSILNFVAFFLDSTKTWALINAYGLAIMSQLNYIENKMR